MVHSSEPVALARVYILAPQVEDGETIVPSISWISPREALMELVRYAYLLDFTDQGRLKEQFERLGRVASLPIFYRLTFPWDLARLPAVLRIVEDHIGDLLGR